MLNHFATKAIMPWVTDRDKEGIFSEDKLSMYVALKLLKNVGHRGERKLNGIPQARIARE